MSVGTYQARIIQKHDTKANWDNATGFIPKKGEVCVYDADGTTLTQPRIKIGDGKTTITGLPFFGSKIEGDLAVTGAITQAGNAVIDTSTIGDQSVYKAKNLSYNGVGSTSVSAAQTSEAYYGSTDNTWASYLIFNHGDGSNYYHQMIRMPFNDAGIPQYQKMVNGVLKGWKDFITSENIGSQSVNYATTAGSASANGGTADYAKYVKDSQDDTAIAITYAKDKQESTSYLASWNGYEIGAIAPGKLSVNYATTAGTAHPDFANSTFYAVGDDAQIGDHDVGGHIGIQGLNANTGLDFCKYGDKTNYKSITYDGTTLYMNGSCDYASSAGYAYGVLNELNTSNTSDTWVPVMCKNDSGNTVFRHRAIPADYNSAPSTLSVKYATTSGKAENISSGTGGIGSTLTTGHIYLQYE